MSEWHDSFYAYLGLFMFSVGIYVLLSKKNLVFMLIGVELMLNAANILLAFFSMYDDRPAGEIMGIFSVVLTICEVAVALAILILIFKKQQISNLEELNEVGNE